MALGPGCDYTINSNMAMWLFYLSNQAGMGTSCTGVALQSNKTSANSSAQHRLVECKFWGVSHVRRHLPAPEGMGCFMLGVEPWESSADFLSRTPLFGFCTRSRPIFILWSSLCGFVCNVLVTIPELYMNHMKLLTRGGCSTGFCLLVWLTLTHSSSSRPLGKHAKDWFFLLLGRRRMLL